MILCRFQRSIEYAERSSEDIMEFNQVDDGHRLSESHTFILNRVQKLPNYSRLLALNLQIEP